MTKGIKVIVTMIDCFRAPVPIIMSWSMTKGIMMMIVMMIDCLRTPVSIILRMRRCFAPCLPVKLVREIASSKLKEAGHLSDVR